MSIGEAFCELSDASGGADGAELLAAHRAVVVGMRLVRERARPEPALLGALRDFLESQLVLLDFLLFSLIY